MPVIHIYRLMGGILGICMMIQIIFWTRGFVNKRKSQVQVNLITRKEVFKLESAFLFYLMFEGSTVLFDHLFNPISRLYFTILTSIMFDIFILLIFPTMVLYRSMVAYPLLWTGDKFEIKINNFLIISGPIEPRRDFTQNRIKRQRKTKKMIFRMKTIAELPSIVS